MRDNKITTIVSMDVTAPHPLPPLLPQQKKLSPPFLEVYLRKLQNNQASHLQESPLKDF